MYKRINAIRIVFIFLIARTLITSQTSIKIEHEDERDNEHNPRLVLIHALSQHFFF